jgi:hypothetical protein
MNLYLLQQYQFIQQLYNNSNYLDILMNVDDFFDILHIYSYKNWLEAEVVDAKFLKYFTNIVLKADRNDKDRSKDKCPDPKGGILLTKYDCKVEYIKTTEKKPREVHTKDDVVFDNRRGKYIPRIDDNDIWVVQLMIPNKHLINNTVYDLQAAQDKLNDDTKSDNADLDSVTTNNDETTQPTETQNI